MVEISAQLVKELRDKSGAAMMDCKKALVEASGDAEKAFEILRQKGVASASKKASRSASEGLVVGHIANDGKSGALIEVNCETDFVARNDNFVNLTNKIADIALEKFPATLADLLALPYEGSVTIGEKVAEQNGIIGEKVELSRYEPLTGAQLLIYNHSNNKRSVLVALNKDGEAFSQAGRDVAMQIAAMNPISVSKDDVDQTVIAREIEVGKELARNEGKSEDMLEKIALGRLNKFFQESTLLSQKFVKNGDQTVDQYLKSLDKDLTVTAFRHVAL